MKGKKRDSLREEETQMSNQLNIKTLRSPTDHAVQVKKATFRQRLLKKLLGDSQRVTIIVPGDQVSNITIEETEENKHGDDETALPV